MNPASPEHRYVNRELSWLAFNHRVLQEAEREDNPLVERVRFLGIFSDNMDEFFRVRVANLQRALFVDETSKTTLGFGVNETLSAVKARVLELQAQYNATYDQVLQRMRAAKIRILNEQEYSPAQREFASNYFKQRIRTHLVPIMISEGRPFPDLNDGVVYFMVGMMVEGSKGIETRYALIQLPKHLPRFVILPSEKDGHNVTFIDDVIRNELSRVFSLFRPLEVFAHAIKVTRDAEIDMDDDLSMSLMDKMTAGVAARKKGDFVRMIYDRTMPEAMLEVVKKKLELRQSDNMISGSRYHNRKDLISFPDFGRQDAIFPRRERIQHPEFDGKSSLIQQVLRKDILLNYPYHDFGHVVDLMREAAIDPAVESIDINLYRVAYNSRIINALINAAHNGKRVNVVIELYARFDEKNNIRISNLLQEAGIHVGFGVTGLKVHSKLFLITRKHGMTTDRLAYIGTGNFHEQRAKVFCDFGYLTSDAGITQEVADLFSFFAHNYERPRFKHLVVSPYTTRKHFTQLMRQEMKHAKSGRKGHVILKLNNLVDAAMIELLYGASQAGVRVDLIVRGICSLKPGVEGLSDNIRVRSIVGRDLEHGRVLYFANDGNPLYFLSSADWMGRNLDRRVEVSVPIRDPRLQAQVAAMLELQLKDNVRARKLDASLKNNFISGRSKKVRVDSQAALYERYANEGNALT